MKFTVQKGVQRLNGRRQRISHYPFASMQVDESFPLNGQKRATVYAAAKRFAASQDPKWKFYIGLAKDGELYCWRDW